MALDKFKLKDSSIILLKDTNYGVAKRISALDSVNPEARGIVLNLIDVVFAMFGKAVIGCEVTEDFRKDNETLFVFTDFLAKAVVLSYYGLLDNDKNLAKLRQRAEEAHQKEIAEGKASGKKLDFMFGFDGLSDVVAVAVGFINDISVPAKMVEGRAMSNMLGSMRKIGIGEYLSGGYADMDIELVALLSNRSESELNEFVTEYIKTDDTFNSCYKDSLEQVMTVYKYLFQDSFGLRPYVGVVSFSDPYIHVIDDTMRLNTLPTARTSFDAVSTALKRSFEVRERMDRQFDVKAIINSSDSKPLYYPAKILEYAMGRELTYELSENVYRNYANNRSWEEYAKGYVEPGMVQYFLDCIYYSLERHFDFGGSRGSETEDFFISNNFSGILSEYGEDRVKTYLSSADMLSRVVCDLDKLKKSLCTAVVAVRYNNLGSKVNAITIRVVDTVGGLNGSITGDLFRSFTTNEQAQFEKGDEISDGKFVGGDQNKPLPYKIYEYRHDFDSALATAEPLFGYKAVEMFKARGISLGWDKILLGEDTKGTPVFASRIDLDDFMMQKYTIHNMMAGSRSGKGVMTMNMLASGIASGKPIFYIDRKPDMAVLFYELSGGNMFVINGGQYEGKNDANGIFGDTGAAVSGWDTAYDRMPKYLRDAFFSSRTYSGNFGDYVYFRAVLFTLGILMARVELAGDAEIYNKLGGDTGIVIVIDEFKNWQVQFESVFFSPDGLFCNQHRLVKSVKESYKKTKNVIKSKTADLQSCGDDEKGAARAAKLQFEIESAQESLKDMVSELDVHCTTLMDKYGESVKHISGKLSAGFKDSEGVKSDIFVIGQHIEIAGFDGSSEPSGTYPRRDSGGFNVNNDTKGKSLMRGLFNKFQHDWFMGYNEDGEEERHYLGADIRGTMANKWVAKQKYWAYCPNASMETLRHGAPDGTRYFKPYLVLNKHLEDDPNNPVMISVKNDKGVVEQVSHPDYSFVSQCRSRVNDAVPGAQLWETVRLKHLRSESMAEEARNGGNKYYGELNEGIGFQGLASQTKMVNGAGAFDPSADLGGSKAIADYVAQCMGYSNYLELLFDFSKEGLFSTVDIVRALRDHNSFKGDMASRLPLFAEYNLLDGANDAKDRDNIPVIKVEESGMYNPDLYDALPEPESSPHNHNKGSVQPESGIQVNNKDLVQSEKPAVSMFSEEGTDVSVNNEGRPNMSMFASEQSGGAWTESPDVYGSQAGDSGYDKGGCYPQVKPRVPVAELVGMVSQVFTQTMNLLFQKYGSVNLKDPMISSMCNSIVSDIVVEYLKTNGYEV